MKASFGFSFALLLLSSMVVNAQKLGYINSENIVQIMPEAKVADSLIEVFKKSLIQKDSTMQMQYDILLANIGERITLTDSIKNSRQKELQDLQTKIQNLENSAQTQLQTKNDELYAPIIKKVNEAVKAVAIENGYLYVFDMSGGAVVYAYDEGDITAQVKKKLGLK